MTADPEPYQLVRLANGTFSIHSRAENETFHPVVGPVAEAQALYVNQLKLPQRVADGRHEFVIWDVGLGAAANVLTVLGAIRGVARSVRILSFDRTTQPLAFALRHQQQLNYIVPYSAAVEELLAHGRANVNGSRQSVRWELHLGDFPQLLSCAAEHRSWPAPDAILFDAFSPAKNPEMWTARLFSDLFRGLDPRKPCAMATYSRSTMLRVTLLLAGFFTGVGHATGEKEETTIATNRLEMLESPLPLLWLDRARKSKSAEPLWSPVYRQDRLSESSLKRLLNHPQFAQA